MADAPVNAGLLESALAAYDVGMSVVAVKADGTKIPEGEPIPPECENPKCTEKRARAAASGVPPKGWIHRQHERADRTTVERRFGRGDGPGLGLVTGAVSRNTEMLELEARAMREGLVGRLHELADAFGCRPVLERVMAGYTEMTPTGGLHLLYRVEGPALPNTKLARRPATEAELAEDPDDKIKVLIETRGEGGYTVAAPSNGTVHPTGERWELLHGGFDSIATITEAERDELYRIARLLDAMPVNVPRAPRPPGFASSEEPTPWSVYDEAPDAQQRTLELLERHGWEVIYESGGALYLRRPGKAIGGPSATLGHVAPGVLYVFSTSTEFEAEHAYGPFDVYKVLEHGGDGTAAARALRPREAPRAREQPAPAAEGLFRRWTMEELLAADRTFKWLVRGVIVDPTYGQSAGEAKTLKTHITTFLNVAVASGQRVFDRFEVDRCGPVLIYVGEGGRVAHTRLLERVAQALDVDPARLPITPTYDVAPVTSTRFEGSLARDLREIQPVHFNLDPLYAYHGAKTNSSNLHEEGALLTSVSAQCIEAGATCWITNHFNQTGTGQGLQRITQAGSTEWVDSWLLVAHREAPDVPGGHFRLRLEIGSRQWGGTSWDLDLDVGRFDPDLRVHDGAITWDLRRAEGGNGNAARDRIVAAVTEEPGEYAKEDLAKRVGGNLKEARRLVKAAEDDGVIRPQLVHGTRSDGRRKTDWRYFPAAASDPSSGEGRRMSEGDA